MIDLLDSEVLKLETVTRWMQEQQGKSMNLEGFRRAAIEKFAEQGFVVDVKVYTTTQEGVYLFEPQINGRIEEKEFDFDRMAHEVRNNILELPDQEGGVIKADAELARIERQRKMGMLPKHKH